MTILTHRKIGGMHWLFIGRLRIAWCVRAKRVVPKYLRSATQLDGEWQ
jgi:hypothetical protein